MRTLVTSIRKLRLGTLFSVMLIVALPSAATEAGEKAKRLQIGMAKSFFYERSKSSIEIAADDFKDVMKKTTGLDGELIAKYDAAEVAQKLNEKQLDFGIFHALELAWLQKKHADFRPLMISANKQREERAYVIVHKSSAAKALADLRGKKIDVPAATKQRCRLFLEKHCTDKGQKGLAEFFGAIEKSPTPGAALDDLARGKLDAAVVDETALAHYKEVRGPVFEKNLRVLDQSEVFPPSVIVFKEGAIDQAVLKQFRDGLLKAHTTDQGREMMKEWNIEAFEVMPTDYAKRLDDVLKAYPPPAPK